MQGPKENAALASTYRRQYEQLRREKQVVEGKIERLEQAKRDLGALCGEFFEYQRRICSRTDRIADPRFKGDWWGKYADKISGLSQEANRIKERHEENTQRIEAEIRTLSATGEQRAVQMKSVLATIDRLLG